MLESNSLCAVFSEAINPPCPCSSKVRSNKGSFRLRKRKFFGTLRLMQNLVAALLFLLPLGVGTGLSVADARTNLKNAFIVDTGLNYVSPKKTVQLQKRLILINGESSWTALTENKGGVVVLGRLQKADSESLHMDYIVL